MFSALADPTRRAILEAVAAVETATATELAAGMAVSRQAVAKHLQALSEAGLVASERRGREQRFRLTPAPFTDAVAWLVDVGAAWDDRLARLEQRARRRS